MQARRPKLCIRINMKSLHLSEKDHALSSALEAEILPLTHDSYCTVQCSTVVTGHTPGSSTGRNNVPQVALDTPTSLLYVDPAGDTSQKLH